MSGSFPPAAWVRAAECRLVDHWTAEIVTELRRRGVRTILLKGPVVARWLYAEDPGLRSYVDVDLLVAPPDRAPAEEGLRALGFTSTVPLRPRHAIRKHADEWRRQRDGAEVDLHVALHGTERVAGARVWEAVAAGTERWDVDGVEVEVPGLVARTLHTVLNLIPDDPLTSKAAEDLRRAIDRVDPVTWAAAGALARDLGVAPEMGAKLARIPAGAALAQRLGLPTDQLEHLFPVAQHASVPLLGLWHFRSLPGTRAKVEYTVDVFLPPPPFLRARWSIARRGGAGLLAGYVAWIGYSFARGGWALLRIPSLRRRWDGQIRHGDASPPATQSRPAEVTRPRAAPTDRALALLCLPVVHLVLQLLGPGATRRVLRLLPASRRTAPAAAVVGAVEGAARLLHLGNCLSRSLTAQAMLHRHGLPSDLRIGVQSGGAQFAAHAWLEHDGVVLNDEPAVVERFAAFDEAFGLGRLRWQATSPR